MWIAHVLHANERKGKTKQRRREDYLEWRGMLVVVCSGLRWRRLWLDPVALLFFFFFPVQRCQSLHLLLLLFFMFSFSRFSPLYLLSIPLFVFFFYLSFPLFFFSLSVFFFLLSISRPFFLFYATSFLLFSVFRPFLSSSSFSLFCSFSSLILFFPFALFPCIYRKNRGERGRGSHCAAAPPPPEGNLSSLFSNTWKALGNWGSFVGLFLTEKMVENRGRRGPTMPQNSTVSGFFFNEKWMKRRYFGQNVSFHLKEKGSKNVSKSKSVFNLWFVQSSPQLQFWF